MEPQNPHIARAEELISSMNLAGLIQAGIVRDRHSYDFIVQYPPTLTMGPISEEEICR